MYSIEPYPFDKKDTKLPFFPTPLRCVIVGSSGCGKTTLLWNLMKWLKYEYLYVFTKSIEQPFYATLQKAYQDVESTEGVTRGYFYQDDMTSVDDCHTNSLVVFDDCILAKQDVMKDYFVRSRHKNISCVYLSQNWTKLDCGIIRNNLNFLCVFKQNSFYTRLIYRELADNDMSLEDFKTLCKTAWKEAFGFLTINLTKKVNNGKYCVKFVEVELS